MIIESIKHSGQESMSKTARFLGMKQQGQKIAVLTGYDAPTAKAEEDSGVDIILVGDSVGTNMLGYASERDVTLADMCHHVGAVRRGAPKTTIIADLPFRSYDTPEIALASSRKLIVAGADIVKFEGPRPEIVEALAGASIAVCCHLGLLPQHHDDKRLKGCKAKEAMRLLHDAIALDAAGMALLVLELVPEEVAERVTKSVKAPTIGIGAGRKTDGQVLVISDVLGYGEANFQHNQRYEDIGRLMREAAKAYVGDVRSKNFPAEENVFSMDRDELAIFLKEKA